jgi:hypothetical protein
MRRYTIVVGSTTYHETESPVQFVNIALKGGGCPRGLADRNFRY